MTIYYGSRSANPCLWLMDLDPAIFFFLFEGTFTWVFKDNKSQRSRKTVGIKVLVTIFGWWQKDPDPYLWLMDLDPDPGGPQTCGSDGTTDHNEFIKSGRTKNAPSILVLLEPHTNRRHSESSSFSDFPLALQYRATGWSDFILCGCGSSINSFRTQILRLRMTHSCKNSVKDLWSV